MGRASNKLAGWFIERPKFSGVISFFFFITLIFLISKQRYDLYRENSERELKNIIDDVSRNLEQSLKNNYTVALTLALTLDNNGQPKNFEKVARELIQSNRDLQAVQLVPNGVIKYVYPLKGNEAVLGINLFKSQPQTVLEVNKAIVLKKMYFQGPVQLTQGGIGVVGRLPLFINNEFWGFSAVAIKLDTLFRNVGIDNRKFANYKFQFSKINPITKQEEFFLPAIPGFADADSKSFIFPEGDWKLYVVNTKSNFSWFVVFAASFFGLGLSILSSFLLMRLLKKQRDLQDVVRNQANQLMDTESKFKKIFDYASVGIARINSKTGQILEINQYLCDFLGYTATELMEKKIKSVIYPDDLAEDRVQFRRLLAGEIRQFSLEKRYLSKNGEVRWGNVMVTPLWNEGEEPSNHIVIVEDITTRKMEQETLIASQKRIESLINTIDGIVWEGHPHENRTTFISNKVYDILGFAPEEWTTAPNFWESRLHPEDDDWVKEYVANAIAERRHHDFEYRMIAKDGTVVWIRDIVSIIDEQRKPLKLRGIMIDVTNRVKDAEALNKSFNMVTEQNKRLLNFSYIVSHNLRSHASNILGITTLIESARTDEDRDEMIQLLKKVSNNLNETLLNLNNVVNIQTSIDIVVEPLNLREYVQKTLATQNAQILFRQAMIVNKIDEDISINFNRAYLESVLLNLVSNALRYSHPDRQPVISLTCTEENGQLVLRVADNGVGIDLKKHGDKIFGIYQTFNGNADARGFGLFITKNQIEAMKGKIAIESTLGEGTTFKIYFE